MVINHLLNGMILQVRGGEPQITRFGTLPLQTVDIKRQPNIASTASTEALDCSCHLVRMALARKLSNAKPRVIWLVVAPCWVYRPWPFPLLGRCSSLERADMANTRASCWEHTLSIGQLAASFCRTSMCSLGRPCIFSNNCLPNAKLVREKTHTMTIPYDTNMYTPEDWHRTWKWWFGSCLSLSRRCILRFQPFNLPGCIWINSLQPTKNS